MILARSWSSSRITSAWSVRVEIDQRRGLSGSNADKLPRSISRFHSKVLF